MRTTRFLTLAALTAAVAWAADPAAAQPPAKKLLKQQLKKKAEEEARKKAEDARKAEEAKKTAAAKSADTGERAEPLKPAFIGGAKDAVAVARFIDQQIDARLSAEKVTPSPACTDAEFVRRVYLDITGVIPTAAEARAFLDDTSADKRAKLIDKLLGSPNYARHQADVWMGLLVQKTSDNRRVDFGPFRDWLAGEFAKNRPWNELVYDLLTASGPQDKTPANGFYLSNNTVDKMTDEVCKTFLGLQLQCAQCHNHPFTGWKQTEYWAMAQFFYKTQITGLNTARGQTPTAAELNGPRRGKNNQLPESAKAVPAKFLQGDSPKLGPSEPYRPVLAKWLTAPTNPFFARAMVNRTWGQYLGVGIVNPIDDMDGHEPSHPELLSALAADFAAAGFDLKHLVRGVCNSQAYQRSSKPTAGNESAAPALFARATMKVLTPEQLFDSLAAVTGFDKALERQRGQAPKGPLGAGTPRDRFVQFYLAGADTANAVEYEAGIPQALKLMNSRITGGGPLAVRQIVRPGMPRTEAVEQLYLATLSRRPTDAETRRLTEYVAKNGNEGYADVLWALLNSSEFTMVR